MNLKISSPNLKQIERHKMIRLKVCSDFSEVILGLDTNPISLALLKGENILFPRLKQAT
jgi:hypothetical protein